MPIRGTLAATTPPVSLPLSLVGAAAGTAPLTRGTTAPYFAIAGGWQTGAVRIGTFSTFVTQTVVDARTPSFESGTIELLAPVRISPSPGPVPLTILIGRLELRFVPEPPRALLALAAAVGLVGLARARRR